MGYLSQKRCANSKIPLGARKITMRTIATSEESNARDNNAKYNTAKGDNAKDTD